MKAISAVEAALQKRSGLPNESTTAFRLFCGEQEGIAGLTIDRYADVLTFQYYVGVCGLSRGELKQLAEALLEKTKTRSTYLKEFVSDRSRQTAPEDLYSAAPFAGAPAPETVEVSENGLRYLIRPYAGFSTGIFLDQRENRRYLAELRPKKILNLFAYTCAFSVAGARAGAETVSVDVSKKYLEWGRENFSCNGISQEGHRFFADDAMAAVLRLTKKGERFDLVVIDPPSFSRDKKAGTFSVEKEIGNLLTNAASVVSPNGLLFFSSNFSGWNTETVFAKAKLALGARIAKRERLPSSPIDFQWESNPLSQILVRLE